jgi:hypothetical protein
MLGRIGLRSGTSLPRNIRCVEVDTGVDSEQVAEGNNSRTRSAKALALALALVFALFFAEVAIHTHENGQDDATCQVCQAAHVAPGPIIAVLISAPLVVFEYVPPIVTDFHQEFLFEDCPSRAPPSLLP